MKLATIRHDGRTRAVRVDGTMCTLLDAPDLRAWMAQPDWQARAAAATGETVSWDDAAALAPVPRPGKTVCVGLNYRTHILEMGRDLPTYPTLFAK
jgi:acylpyruvate hydrolase